MEIEPPTPDFTFVPTSVFEAQWVRAYGVAFCQDNGLDVVTFDYNTTHQYTKHFRITAEGFMETDMDTSLTSETEELRRVQR